MGDTVPKQSVADTFVEAVLCVSKKVVQLVHPVHPVRPVSTVHPAMKPRLQNVPHTHTRMQQDEGGDGLFNCTPCYAKSSNAAWSGQIDPYPWHCEGPEALRPCHLRPQGVSLGGCSLRAGEKFSSFLHITRPCPVRSSGPSGPSGCPPCPPGPLPSKPRARQGWARMAPGGQALARTRHSASAPDPLLEPAYPGST